MRDFFYFSKMKFNFNFLFLALYLIIGFIPNIDSVDRIATHYLYLNIVSFLSITFFLFKTPKLNIRKLILMNRPFLLFLIFGIWALISISYSINFNESIISVFRLFTVITATFMIYLHLVQVQNLKYVFISILFPIIVIEILIPSVKFLEIASNIEYSFKYSNDLKTFTPNKNITAAIITSHIGFFFILKNYLKKFEWLFLLLISIGSAVVVFLSARASIIGLILSLFLIYFITFFKKKENISFVNRVCLSVILGFFVSNLYLGDSNTASLQSRLTSINSDDDSSQQRIRFYTHGINHLLKNPFLGVGIGNWKSKSIEYDNKDIKNYTVPYHLHNDFLQYGTETGVIGMFLYALIFLVLLIINIKRIESNYFLSASLIISLTVLFIDSNLNFPHHRPIMMILFGLIISLTELNRTREFEK